MSYLKNIFIAFLLLILPNKIFALNIDREFQIHHNLKFRSITAKDGLSQNWVRCVYQDSQGFMWFGASGGLNKYDGYTIKTYPLGNVNINDLTQKSKHEFWICNDLGVFIYDQKTDSISPFQYLQGLTVLYALQESNHSVWFGTSIGLFKYLPASDSLVQYQADSGLAGNYVNTLFQDSSNSLWVGTKSGLSQYLAERDSFLSYHANGNPGDLSGNDITRLCEDHEKRLWIGTAKDGLNLMMPAQKEKKFKKIADGAILALLVDQKNKLWVGTSSNGGILQIDLNSFSPDKSPKALRIKRNRIDPLSLSDNSIFCIYEDQSNDIWIGTFGGGVNYFSYKAKKFFTIRSGTNEELKLENDLVNAIWEEDQYLWIGTEGGLDRYDKFTHTTQHFQYDNHVNSSLASDPVYSMFKDSRGNFWVGTWTGGLNQFNYKTNTFKQFIPSDEPGSISSENVFAIYEDSGNNLWIGTVGGGLNRFNYHTNSFKVYRNEPKNPESLYFDIIHDINETKDGQLLVATYGSLDIFDSSSESFTHHLLSAIDSSNNSRFITTIFIDSKQHIWLGTNNGLILFHENGEKSIIVSAKDGLNSNTVQGIEEDSHQNLWISTNKGLCKFVNAVNDPHSKRFIHFYESDGLAGNEFKRNAVFKNKSGQLFFGTSQGFSYFQPDSIQLSQTPPEITFVEMQLLQFQTGTDLADKYKVRNINSINKIELPYNKSDFLIMSAVINYLNPNKNTYKYQLEGYDQDWVNNGIHRTATYKNLQPGRYTLKVMGANNDEVWTTVPKTLKIIIKPPFWQTWIFRIVAALCVLGLVFMLFEIRLKVIQREKRKLAQLVAERTHRLREANSKLEEQSEELSNQNEELRKNQNELSLYKDHLEKLVIKRTVELERAKNKAEESDQLKSAFLANMSHEIRTPLNAITGFALLYDNPNTDEKKRKKYYHLIQSNTKSLLRLMDDILDLSSIETNQLKIKSREFEPYKVLQEIYQQYLPQATENIEFSLKKDDASSQLVITSDEYRFRQILSNLLSNAFKFTEYGKIEFGAYLENPGQLVFFVKDTGIGITEKKQELIFNHFTKIENKTKLFGGIGLGLTLCKLLTKLLGGKIWMESELGKGSTFYFSLPCDQSRK